LFEPYRLGKESEFRAPLIEESELWVSAKPFVATRYPKVRGTKRDQAEDYASPRAFARHVLRQELERRADLPAIVSIDDEELIGAHRMCERSLDLNAHQSKQPLAKEYITCYEILGKNREP
jgi:hypothetical protein